MTKFGKFPDCREDRCRVDHFFQIWHYFKTMNIYRIIPNRRTGAEGIFCLLSNIKEVMTYYGGWASIRNYTVQQLPITRYSHSSIFITHILWKMCAVKGLMDGLNI